MTNRIFAIRYNNTDCLIHLFFNEAQLTVNLLSSELSEDIGLNSFTIDHNGKLVNSLSPHNTINTEAAIELHNMLLANEGEYLKSIQFTTSASQLAKAG